MSSRSRCKLLTATEPINEYFGHFVLKVSHSMCMKLFKTLKTIRFIFWTSECTSLFSFILTCCTDKREIYWNMNTSQSHEVCDESVIHGVVCSCVSGEQIKENGLLRIAPCWPVTFHRAGPLTTDFWIHDQINVNCLAKRTQLGFEKNFGGCDSKNKRVENWQTQGVLSH